MTIKKRLFLSNILMIVALITVFVAVLCLFMMFFFRAEWFRLWA